MFVVVHETYIFRSVQQLEGKQKEEKKEEEKQKETEEDKENKVHPEDDDTDDEALLNELWD